MRVSSWGLWLWNNGYLLYLTIDWIGVRIGVMEIGYYKGHWLDTKFTMIGLLRDFHGQNIPPRKKKKGLFFKN